VRFTRARDLVLTGVVVAVLANLLLILDYDSLPPLPRLAGTTLFVLGLLELALAFTLRARLAGKPGTRPVPALLALRAVALAKASSVLGAIMVGGWLGVLVYVFPKRAVIVAASGDTTSAVLGLISAAALVAAAIWLEYCCRAPQERDHRDDETGLPRSR
jgi:hypothetical protein